MRRRLFLLATILCLLCGLTLSVSAGRPYYAIYDSAGLLDYEEEQAIKEKSTAAMQEAEMGDVEINIIITSHIEYEYSDAIYSTRVLSESQDMILLVVYYSETSHYYEYEVVTFGEAQRAISMRRQNKISDAIYDDVKAGRLTEACEELYFPPAAFRGSGAGIGFFTNAEFGIPCTRLREIQMLAPRARVFPRRRNFARRVQRGKRSCRRRIFAGTRSLSRHSRNYGKNACGVPVPRTGFACGRARRRH